MQRSGSGGALAAGVLAGMPMWIGMCCAMMLPLASTAVRRIMPAGPSVAGHVAAGGFVGGYLLVWAAYGALALALAAVLDRAVGPAAFGGALALAAGWQLSRAKARFLRATRDPLPLRGTGGQRSLETVAHGARNGAACLGSCWAIMLVMALASGERLLWMVALTALVFVEHRAGHERRVLAGAAGALVAAALIILATS